MKKPGQLRKLLLKYFIFRPGIVYAYSCIDPITGKRERWAYAGQTRQILATRHDQHMGNSGYKGKLAKCQPWSDLYPEVRIVCEFKCPDFLLDLVEMWVIKWNKPVYNYMHNINNPRRIPIPIAIKQRAERDLRRSHYRGKVVM